MNNIDAGIMNLHTIDISGGFNKGGYSGTVEVSEGSIDMKFPSASMKQTIKRYHLHLLTPERKNIEINLLRFFDGEWCDDRHLQLDLFAEKSDLREAIKTEIIKMKI